MSLKLHKLHVCGYKDKLPDNAVVVNTTSRSKDFGKALSPFMNQGPIVFGDWVSENVENLWQFSKVYPEHLDDFKAWCAWRDSGLKDKHAHRYPMGKGKRPLFSWAMLDDSWEDFPQEKIDYISARKTIYIPAYRYKLEKYCMKQINMLIGMLHVTDVYLWDFDGFMSERTFDELVNDPNKALGHAFIIKKFIADKLYIGF